MNKLRNILDDRLLIDWLLCGKYHMNLMNLSRKKGGAVYAKQEKTWGIDTNKKHFDYTGSETQWTTNLSEKIMEIVLQALYGKTKKPEIKEGHKPDLETTDAIWEVKSRSYTTTGTAGDKILGVPFKYAKIPKLYGKPLKIVLMGYQEYEAINNFKIFNPDCEEKYELLYEFKSRGIEYVKASDLLKKVIKSEDNYIDLHTYSKYINISMISYEEWSKMNIHKKDDYLDDILSQMD